MATDLFFWIVIGIGTILFFSYAIFANLLVKKSGEQPLKSKSVKLLSVSFFGNCLSTIIVCAGFISIFMQEHHHQSVFFYLVLSASEVIAQPFMFSPYILRLTYSIYL